MKPHLEVIFWGTRSESEKAEMKGDKLGKSMWFPSMLVFRLLLTFYKIAIQL